MSNYSFGWLKQKPDHRDYLYKLPPRLTANLPPSIDLSPGMPEAPDQGQLGSCGPHTAFKSIQYDQLHEQLPVAPPSRLFIYYTTRSLMGTVNQDSGVDNRTMLKALNKYGFCPEALWPYTIQRFTQKPTQEAYTEASKSQITSYAVVQQSLDQMKGCLASGFPFIFGFSVYDSLLSSIVEKTGLIPMPRPGEDLRGGHDVNIVGFDDARQLFKLENSWGKEWGQEGFGWIPYAYAVNPRLASDFWVINAVPGAPLPSRLRISIHQDTPQGDYSLVA